MKKLVYICCILYAILIATNTKYFSPVDDMLIVREFGKNFHQVYEKTDGRFLFTQGFDVAILQLINPWKNNSTIFYIWFAIIFLINSFLTLNIIKTSQISERNKNIILVGMMVLFFTPAWVSLYFRLLMQEKYIITQFLLLFITLKKVENNKKWYIPVFLLCLLLAFTKEAGILASVGIGIGLLLWSLKNNDNSTKITGVMVVFSMITMLVAYYFTRYIYTEKVYGTSSIGEITTRVKALVEWIIADPIIFLLLIPLIGVRIFQLVKNWKTESFSISDIFLFGGSAYIGTFFLTGMHYGEHYLSPLYIILLILFLEKSEIFEKNLKFFYKKRIGKLTGSVLVIFTISNVIVGINTILFEKQNNKNYKNIIEYIVHNQDQIASLQRSYNSDQFYVDPIGCMEFWLNRKGVFYENDSNKIVFNQTGKDLFIKTPYSNTNQNLKMVLIQNYEAIGGFGKGWVIEDLARKVAAIIGDEKNVYRKTGCANAQYEIYQRPLLLVDGDVNF
jgi:hypothetical protein